jgi:hypothetical protein
MSRLDIHDKNHSIIASDMFIQSSNTAERQHRDYEEPTSLPCSASPNHHSGCLLAQVGRQRPPEDGHYTPGELISAQEIASYQ